jgi:hypothetical protein
MRDFALSLDCGLTASAQINSHLRLNAQAQNDEKGTVCFQRPSASRVSHTEGPALCFITTEVHASQVLRRAPQEPTRAGDILHPHCADNKILARPARI